MIFYAASAVFPLLMWFINECASKLYDLDEEQKKKLTFRLTLLAILPMFLLFVLRYKYVGVDTIGYVRFFLYEVRKFSFAELLNQDLMRLEIGYRVYVKIISLFTDNYTIYFLINGIVIFGTLLRFSIKYTQNPFVFLFLFVTLGTYSFIETGLRQALAMMCCLWAVDFIKDKKLIPFILVVFLGYFFHKSAILFLIMYPLSYIKKLNWVIIVYSVFAVVLVLGFAVFQEFFNELVGYNYEIESTGNGYIFVMLILLLFAFSLDMLHDSHNDVEIQTVDLQFSIITIVFWLARLVSRTAERISFYYIFGLYAYFSQAFDFEKDRMSAIFKWLLILVCLALFVYRNFGIGYKFFWQGA